MQYGFQILGICHASMQGFKYTAYTNSGPDCITYGVNIVAYHRWLNLGGYGQSFFNEYQR